VRLEHTFFLCSDTEHSVYSSCEQSFRLCYQLVDFIEGKGTIMRFRAIATAATLASLMCFTAAAGYAQLSAYSQDFEGLVQADPNALGNDGWKIFANVFDGSWNYLYGYGTFPAPNNPGDPAFCLIASGEGGVPQGAQQLVVFSDYKNTDHGIGNIIEANVFQERTIGAGDVGTTWNFLFDAKKGDLGGASTALAFIKTLDPNNSFAQTNFITVDMTSIPATWGTYSLSIAIDNGLVGQILQFGFLSYASNYEPSGIFYDNINFAEEGTVAVEETTWSATKALYR